MNKQTRKAIERDIREKLSHDQLVAKWSVETLREFSNEIENITRANHGRVKALSRKRKKMEKELQMARVNAALKI